MQCFVYSVLYFYLSNIIPGPGGIKKSYLFFLEVCIRIDGVLCCKQNNL